jgi:FixJ family two-component response regulator
VRSDRSLIRPASGRTRIAVLTIHVLEDDPGVSDSLITFLRGMGHETRAYPDAESFFNIEPPGAQDTIIVDLHLPGISDPPTVIAITGQPQSAIEQQIRGLERVRILRKPLNASTIASII